MWTTAFADGPGGGNPCPVVFGAAAETTSQLQARAADFGVETAFVLPAEQGGDVRLRYFVPRHEMEMCVH
ncbi:MAG: trans-2,3-dihydro-3-hydroxyanthranilate isomerase, partial [Pseudonocardiales bacterium]|nr:trans-2,3-dihydro-3-hydroxyanthranilate isomerase [Pseudonocardiales bacterium]